MKTRFLSLLAVVLMATGATAQKMKINLVGNETVKYKISQIESIEFEEEVPIGDLEYVDLGLPSGTLWASCNIGASKPEESGDYFAWGETETKDSYTWYSYRYCDGNDSSMKKYCLDAEYGTVDGKSELESGDDAAIETWGSGWVMPTLEQQKELANNCSQEWTQLNGVNGVLLTGPSGKSIFLPAAGYYNENGLKFGGERGYYWSRTLDPDFHHSGAALYFTSSNCYDSNFRRYRGLPVRPVRLPDYVDLGLPSGTLWATCNIGANSPEEYGDYFAWGETEPKIDYSWETYKWCMGSYNTLTKYVYKGYGKYGYNGFTDDIPALLPEDDAAAVNLGEDWETPVYGDFKELFENTIGEFTEQNGVWGLKITSDINNNSIFLPAAGSRGDTELYGTGVDGIYWSASLAAWSTWYVYTGGVVFFNSDKVSYETDYCNRCVGLPVRPIMRKK